jgi:hypothetical protein
LNAIDNEVVLLHFKWTYLRQLFGNERRRDAERETDLTRRRSQPLTGIQPHFMMINTRSFQVALAVASGG